MKVDVIQHSFASGEIGPPVLGRSDITQYATACELVRNMIPRSYGSVISAPGSRYIATVSDSTLRARLISFVFNQADAYIIEMGDLYMRFFTDRGAVQIATATEDFSGLAANLVAQWKFNDNTNSTVVLDTGATYNGTSSTNTNNLTATGKASLAFDFDGQYAVSIADNAAFTFIETAKFSVCAWVYYESTGSNQTIISKWASSNHEWRLYTNASGHLVFELEDQSANKNAYIEADTALTTGWHFVVGTYDGRGGSSAANGLDISVDNVTLTDVSRTTESGYVAMENLTASVTIGRRTGTPADFWQNKIDTPAVFNTNLSSAQISSIYSSSLSTFQLTTPFAEDEIEAVQYAQLNDIIWLTHPNHPPQQLVRTSATEWTIGDFAFIGGPFLDANETTTKLKPSGTAKDATINVTASTAVFTLSGGTLGHVNSLFRIGGLAETHATTGLEEYGVVKITHVIDSLTATATVIRALKSTTATDNWAEGAWSGVSGFPSAVHFHERRLWFGRTNAEPQKLWGSKTFIYENFALDTEEGDDGLNLALASNESNEIRWLSSSKALFAGTFGGVFIVNSGSEDAITPDSVTASEDIRYGASSVIPKVIGGFVYYIQKFGKKMREMTYLWDEDSHKAFDRTILSPHMLEDQAVDMAVQNNPESILYCVTGDGAISTLTREIDQQVVGWAKHTTDGTYTSVAVIPSQSYNYDEVWFIVERWVNSVQSKYIEVFENIEVPDRQDQCLYLHSALTYDAYESTSTSNATISLSASSGSVTLTSSTAYFNGGMINKRLRAINSAGTTIGEGTITATGSTTSITLSITTTFNALSYATGLWGVSVSSVAGMTHLNTKTVGILADGQTESLTRTVNSGVVTLGSNYFVISIGLSYDQILFTLPPEAGNERGTAQGKFQRYNEISFKVNRTTQDFKYGPDSSNLDDLVLAITPTVTTLYTGVIPPQAGGVAMRGGYKRGAQIYIKNSKPLPIEILNIMGTLDTYEK